MWTLPLCQTALALGQPPLPHPSPDPDFSISVLMAVTWAGLTLQARLSRVPGEVGSIQLSFQN